MNTTTTTPKLNKYGTDLAAIAASVHPGLADTDIVTITCGRCGGTGYINFSTLDSSRCWECHTIGHLGSATVGALRTRAKRQATAADRRAAKAAAETAKYIADREAKATAWAAENSDLHAALTTDSKLADELPGLASDVRNGGTPTPQQTAYARTILDRETAKTQTEPLPEGRITITGAVATKKTIDTAYGTAVKMVVELDGGQRVYGTLPSALYGVERGQRVTFTATVTRSDDDHTFGWFKRPTKAALID